MHADALGDGAGASGPSQGGQPGAPPGAIERLFFAHDFFGWPWTTDP